MKFKPVIELKTLQNGKCSHCEACRSCELLKVWQDLSEVCNRVIEIHNTTSDCVFSNQLMYQEAIQAKSILLSFQRQLKQLGIDV